MKLHPLLQAVIRILPDFRYIFDVRFNMGRSKVSWVYGRTKYGVVSRFVSRKKLTEYFWKNSDTVINLKRRQQYITTLDNCTCPAFKWGKTQRCKHMDMLQERLRDAVIKRNPKTNFIQVTEQKTPPGMTLTWNGENDSDMSFDIKYHSQYIGYISQYNEGAFELYDKNQKYIGEFENQVDAYETLLQRAEVEAAQDLFGEDLYPVEQTPPPNFPQWGTHLTFDDSCPF